MPNQGDHFTSGTTSKAMLLAAVPLAVAAYLGYNGLYYATRFPGAKNLPWRVLFSFVPLAFAAVLVGTTLYVLLKSAGRSITLGADGLIYTQGAENFTMPWSITAFSQPKAGALGRVMAITDGKHVVRVEELFFKDFDRLVSAMAEAKKLAKG